MDVAPGILLQSAQERRDGVRHRCSQGWGDKACLAIQVHPRKLRLRLQTHEPASNCFKGFGDQPILTTKPGVYGGPMAFGGLPLRHIINCF